MPEVIDSFRGENYFLSNFFTAPVEYNGLTFKNSEAAFHSQKDPTRANEFCRLNPSESKWLGHHVALREDWEHAKDNIMYEIVRNKFEQNDVLKQKLLATGDAELIEGNTWGDTYWGVSNGRGQNHLGNILMRVRKELGGE